MATCLIVAVSIWSVHQKHLDRWPIDKANLSVLMNAVFTYSADYGDLPPESEFKALLLKHNLVTDETVFHSTCSGIPFRYYTSGDHFVLVGPGANGRYETPEGYVNIEASKDRGDDIVRRAKVPGKARATRNGDFLED